MDIDKIATMFPCLYAALPVAAASSIVPIPVGADGRHVLDGLIS